MIYVALLLFFFPMGYGKSSQFTSLNKRNHLKLFEAKQSQRIKKSQAHSKRFAGVPKRTHLKFFFLLSFPFFLHLPSCFLSSLIGK